MYAEHTYGQTGRTGSTATRVTVAATLALVGVLTLAAHIPIFPLENSHNHQALAVAGPQNTSTTTQQEGLPLVQGNSVLPRQRTPTQQEETGTAEERYRTVVTGYSSERAQTDETPFITASGSRVEHGVIASNLLPFGTRVRIPELFGDKIFTVEDRMNPRKGKYHIDVWFPSKEEALSFGAHRTYIEVVAYPPASQHIN